MKKPLYNWWKDPKNKEEVEELSWWNHVENKETFNFPLSVTNEGEYWTATLNNDTEKILGDNLNACASGKTKEEAIELMFEMIKDNNEYLEDCVMNYQRFVPFRCGDWKHTGGKWIVFFGIHFYFRYGKAMKYGWYIPFTKLNISISNEWTDYSKFKKKHK
jgi:hypothetical protein